MAKELRALNLSAKHRSRSASDNKNQASDVVRNRTVES